VNLKSDQTNLVQYVKALSWWGELMQGPNKERWRLLCEQAAVEKDPKKLLELTKEINDLLLGKQHRLESETPPGEPNDSK
jgi:hypothetical protein